MTILTRLPAATGAGPLPAGLILMKVVLIWTLLLVPVLLACFPGMVQVKVSASW